MMTDAIRVFCLRAKLGTESVNIASEIKARAERRAGELLAGMKKNAGGRPSKTGCIVQPVLDEIGIEKTQSHRWQRVASIPESDFESHLADKKEAGEPITTGALVKLAKEINVKEPRRKAVVDERETPRRTVGAPVDENTGPRVGAPAGQCGGRAIEKAIIGRCAFNSGLSAGGRRSGLTLDAFELSCPMVDTSGQRAEGSDFFDRKLMLKIQPLEMRIANGRREPGCEGCRCNRWMNGQRLERFMEKNGASLHRTGRRPKAIARGVTPLGPRWRPCRCRQERIATTMA